MLMRNERLARLRTRFQDTSHTLTIEMEGREAARGDLRTSEGRAAIEAFLAGFCAGELRGPPRVLHAPGFSFSDVARKVVSIINLASVAAIEDVIGRPVHPLRFRGNVYVTGWPAWREFDFLGQEITVARGPRLRVIKRIVRCAATNVDPGTGIRDLSIPDTLMRSFGHADCGVYGELRAQTAPEEERAPGAHGVVAEVPVRVHQSRNISRRQHGAARSRVTGPVVRAAHPLARAD